MTHHNVDFHIHTNLSDGLLSHQEILSLAERNDIGVLAFTDHNRTCDLTYLRQAYPEIQMLQGAEISCSYQSDIDGIEPRKTHEIHVVALGFDPNHPQMQEIFRANSPNRTSYIEAILHRLRNCGVDIGTFESIQKQYPESNHIGRIHVASEMVRQGYVRSVTEAFDEFIGSFGRRRAFVHNELQCASLEQAVSAIKASGGIAVIAHLFLYQFNEWNNARLLKTFKDLAGDRGAMETEYGAYTRQQRDHLRHLALANGLMPSAGSDFHGADSSNTLGHHFHCSHVVELLEALGVKQLGITLEHQK